MLRHKASSAVYTGESLDKLPHETFSLDMSCDLPRPCVFSCVCVDKNCHLELILNMAAIKTSDIQSTDDARRAAINKANTTRLAIDADRAEKGLSPSFAMPEDTIPLSLKEAASVVVSHTNLIVVRNVNHANAFGSNFSQHTDVAEP